MIFIISALFYILGIIAAGKHTCMTVIGCIFGVLGFTFCLVFSVVELDNTNQRESKSVTEKYAELVGEKYEVNNVNKIEDVKPNHIVHQQNYSQTTSICGRGERKRLIHACPRHRIYVNNDGSQTISISVIGW